MEYIDEIRKRTKEEDQKILNNINDLCKNEHLSPPINCHVKLEVSDQDDNIVDAQEFRSMSWVRNYYNALFMGSHYGGMVYPNTIGGGVIGDGSLAIRKLDNSINSSTTTVSPNLSVSYSGGDSTGLIVGSSDAPEIFDMGGLMSQYIEGSSIAHGRLWPYYQSNTSFSSNYIYSSQFSPDSNYLAQGGSGELHILQNVGNDRFNTTTLTQPTSPGTISHIAWHPSGTYVVFSAVNTPYIHVYKNNGNGSFTKLTSPTAPAGALQQIQWSPNGNYFTVITVTSSPYLYVYKNNGDDTFTRITPTSPAGSCSCVAWSSNSSYFVVMSNSANYLMVYKNNGDDTFTKITPTDISGSPRGISWSPDNTYFCVVASTSPYAWIYKNNGNDTFTQIALSPGAYGHIVSWSPNGSYFVFVTYTGSIPIIYKNNNNDTFTKLTSPSAAITNPNSEDYYKGIAWALDNSHFYFFTSASSNPTLVIYKMTATDTFTKQGTVPKIAYGGFSSSTCFDMAPNGNYIAVGGSNATVTIYKLQTSLNHVLGTIAVSYDSTNKKMVSTLTRIFNNNSSSSAIVKEIGVLSSDGILMSRDVLATPVTVAPAYKLTATFTFAVSIPSY